MSKNISNLSGRIGLKKNLFEKISERSLNSKDSSGIKEIADEYHMGVSTIHGAESFYEFLRPAHRAKKAFVCNGSACMCSGTQEPLKKKLREKLGDDKVGEMFCLGHCYENKAFHYDGENYAGNDINKIDEIIKGEKIEQEKFFSKSFASTSFLMDDKLSNLDQFKDMLSKFINTDKQKIIKSLLDSNLTGRGGAGFPTGMKWDFCGKAKSEKKYVICNADEGDSGAFSDRYLLEDQPLKVLFGMIICGYVIGSDEGVLYIRGEYPKSIEAINGAINSLKKEGLLGENILGTNFSFDLNICIGQGAYICGEETALIASIEGRRAEVDVRPPFPVTEGLYKKPTVVNNVETLAAATGILINGADKFSAIGNKKSAGTKLVCFDSFFNNPGVYEVEMGTPMKIVLNDIGGGFKEPIKALQIAASNGTEASYNHWDGSHFLTTRVASKRAYDEAGIKNPKESLSLIEVHDCFSVTELVTMEDLHISAEGKAPNDIMDGFYDSDGNIPCQIDGGLKCFGHPIGASGIRMLYEMYLQLLGRAAERQRSKVDICLTHNLGGFPHENVAAVCIVGRND